MSNDTGNIDNSIDSMMKAPKKKEYDKPFIPNTPCFAKEHALSSSPREAITEKHKIAQQSNFYQFVSCMNQYCTALYFLSSHTPTELELKKRDACRRSVRWEMELWRIQG